MMKFFFFLMHSIFTSLSVQHIPQIIYEVHNFIYLPHEFLLLSNKYSRIFLFQYGKSYLISVE